LGKFGIILKKRLDYKGNLNTHRRMK